MNAQTVEDHCLEIERCNQRGGRMLSIVDLIEAGTVTPELAAYCLAAIRAGGSFMVGANPGGAGKTTVMAALLGLVAGDTVLCPADTEKTLTEAFDTPTPRRCFVCHEIGAGPYYAYLWGRELRLFFRLPEVGHVMATNLHADTCDEARAQVCGENQVPPEHFQRMNLALFLKVMRDRGRRREIVAAWESDGHQPHRCVYRKGEHEHPGERSTLVSPGTLVRAAHDLDTLLASGARTIAEVRRKLLECAETGTV
jgi:hypothetical protein